MLLYVLLCYIPSLERNHGVFVVSSPHFINFRLGFVQRFDWGEVTTKRNYTLGPRKQPRVPSGKLT